MSIDDLASVIVYHRVTEEVHKVQRLVNLAQHKTAVGVAVVTMVAAILAVHSLYRYVPQHS